MHRPGAVALTLFMVIIFAASTTASTLRPTGTTGLVPSTDVEVRVLHKQITGPVTTFRVRVTPILRDAFVEISLLIPPGARLISGSQNWRGTIAHSQEFEYSFTVIDDTRYEIFVLATAEFQRGGNGRGAVSLVVDNGEPNPIVIPGQIEDHPRYGRMRVVGGRPITSGAVTTSPPPTTTAFTIQGKFLYENRVIELTSSSTAAFTNVDSLPIRFADVEAFNGATSLGTAITDANGDFTIAGLASTGTININVKCMASNSMSPGAEIMVSDGPSNSVSPILWVKSQIFNHDTSSNLDFRLTPVVAEMGAGGPTLGVGPAGAFNIFDVCVQSKEYVELHNGGTGPSPHYS